jgi:hypothetical protein
VVKTQSESISCGSSAHPAVLPPDDFFLLPVMMMLLAPSVSDLSQLRAQTWGERQRGRLFFAFLCFAVSNAPNHECFDVPR